MFRKDTIVWEIIGETFWLVALIGALVFGLIAQAHPGALWNNQPGSGVMVQVVPETGGRMIIVDPIRIGKY